MNIDAAAVSRMTLVRCHRVGRNIPNFKRPIIMRFLDYNNKKLIWNKRFDIIDKTLSIWENYANNIEYRRRLLDPIVKKAKQSPKYGKAYIKADSNVVNNSTYNLHKLPKDLHPKQFSYKENKDWLILADHTVLTFCQTTFHTNSRTMALCMTHSSTLISMPRQFILKIQQLPTRYCALVHPLSQNNLAARW